LQIRYNLGGTREPYNIDVDHRNMANGQPHSVNITRHERTIILKKEFKIDTCQEKEQQEDAVLSVKWSVIWQGFSSLSDLIPIRLVAVGSSRCKEKAQALSLLST
ncbi:hypothetical protein P7K49_025857, partial [Saguinus oedipus]